MNRSRASSRAVRLAAESMPAPGDDDELGDAVGGLEGLHDGDDRGGLSLVGLPAANLERKTGPVNRQIILTLGLEVEGGHACRHRARPPLAVTCSNRA